MFNLLTGKKIKELHSHKDTISTVNKDDFNNIFVTSSQNGIIYAQKEIVYDEDAIENIIRRKRQELDQESAMTNFNIPKALYSKNERRNMRLQIKEDMEAIENIEKEKLIQIDDTQESIQILRSLEMPRSFKGIKKVFTSVYENIIAVITFDGRVDILNYEYMMAVKGIKFPEKKIPLEISIIEGYRHMLITCSNGLIYLFKFEFYTYSKLNLNMVNLFKIQDLSNRLDNRKFEDFSSKGFNSKRIIKKFRENNPKILKRGISPSTNESPKKRSPKKLSPKKSLGINIE